VDRQLIEHLPAGVVVFGPDSRIVLCNRKAADLLGFRTEDLLGKTARDPIWSWVHEEPNAC
jgi:PAS domain S-box-containing protein